MKLVISILASVGVVTSTMAQEPVTPDTMFADTIIALPEMVVHAPTTAATAGGTGTLQTRIDSMPVPAASTVEDILRATPMIHVRSNSRGQAEISVRGSESRQVAVLVDGVPITLAWDGRADVSVIPASAPQELLFVRGLSSLLHGPNVLGGVVELNVGSTLAQPSKESVAVSVGVDDTGGYRAGSAVSLPLSGPGGNWLFRVGGSHYNSPGVPLPRGVSEPIGDPSLRLNTDATSVDAFASVRCFTMDGAWFSLSGSTFRMDRGVPAELGVPDEDARLWRYPHESRSLVVASGGWMDRTTPWGRGEIQASIGLDAGRTEIVEYVSREYDEPSGGFEQGDYRTLTARVLGKHTVTASGDIETAVTYADIRHDEILPRGEARYRQRLMSFAAEGTWRVLEGMRVRSLDLTGGIVQDIGQTPEAGGKAVLGTLTGLGGRFGATATLHDAATAVHGGVSRRTRFPALRELYSGSLNRFAPNEDLRPEELTAFEGGITTRRAETEFQVVGFRHRLRNAVVRTTLPDGRFRRVNRDRLESTGIELLVTKTAGAFEIGGDATLQKVRQTDTASGETMRPENLPAVAGGFHAAYATGWKVRAFAEVRFTGSQRCTAPGSGDDTTLDAGAVLNLRLGRRWDLRSSVTLMGQLEASVSVDNVLDTALYDQCGLPRPGRLVRFQVQVR